MSMSEYPVGVSENCILYRNILANERPSIAACQYYARARKQLVKSMLQLGERVCLSRESTHLSIQYMDMILSRYTVHKIEKSHFYITAVACMVLSGIIIISQIFRAGF